MELTAGLTGTNRHTKIVLSFAGEQRQYVREVAEHLKDCDVAVFFDEYEEATMWGKHLTEHLAAVYGGTARYCVMFISKEHAEKVWTAHGRRAAFAKAVMEKKEYVLPARFDDRDSRTQPGCPLRQPRTQDANGTGRPDSSEARKVEARMTAI